MTKLVFVIWLLVVVTAVGAEEAELSLDPEQEIFLPQVCTAGQSQDANQI